MKLPSRIYANIQNAGAEDRFVNAQLTTDISAFGDCEKIGLYELVQTGIVQHSTELICVVKKRRIKNGKTQK